MRRQVDQAMVMKRVGMGRQRDPFLVVIAFGGMRCLYVPKGLYAYPMSHGLRRRTVL